jgi:hypothetical protein
MLMAVTGWLQTPTHHENNQHFSRKVLQGVQKRHFATSNHLHFAIFSFLPSLIQLFCSKHQTVRLH